MKEIGGTGSRGFSGPSSPLSPYPPVRAARSGYDFTVAASCRILPAVQRGGRLLRSKPVHDQNDIAAKITSPAFVLSESQPETWSDATASRGARPVFTGSAAPGRIRGEC